MIFGNTINILWNVFTIGTGILWETTNLVFKNPICSILIIFVIAFFLCFFVSQDINETFFHQLGLITSLFAFFIGAILFQNYNVSTADFQFTITLVDFAPVLNSSISFGVDGISLCFLLLTLFIFPICFIALFAVKKNVRQLVLILLSVEFLLVLTFTCTDLLFFYIFFESILIPMFLMIGLYGARERKIKASYYFFLYTLFGSLVMLFGILYLYSITATTSNIILLNYDFSEDEQIILWLAFFMAFAVKIPMFPFHIWLLEAHVESPTIGSVILASLLLKLGGYGFIRFSLPMFPFASNLFSPLITMLSLLGLIYASLATIRQIDFKRIIAYSSIAHMNLLVLGLFSFTKQGIEGAIYLMIAHGIVSSALFFCVGVLYDRHHSRLLRYYGGLAQVMPLFSIVFFFFTLANMGFPITCNFVGELLVLVGIFQKNSAVVLLAATGVVLSAIYSIWLFNRVIFGTLKTKDIKYFIDLNRIEIATFLPLIISGLFFGIHTTIIFELLSTSVDLIVMKNFLI